MKNGFILNLFSKIHISFFSLDSLMPYSSPSDIYSDDNTKPQTGDNISIDTTRPEQSGLDDTFRPTVDSELIKIFKQYNDPPNF